MTRSNVSLFMAYKSMEAEDPGLSKDLVRSLKGPRKFFARRTTIKKIPTRVWRTLKTSTSSIAIAKKPCLFTAASISALLFVFLQSLVMNRRKTGSFIVPFENNQMYGPSTEVLFDLGALSTNEIRKGNLYRLFWGMWMHAGWLHLAGNVVAQAQCLIMIEPDWGLFRTLCLYLVSGLMGNLMSCCFDPCSITVGSSGCLFGLIGGLIPYCMEFWKTIPRPGLILGFIVVVIAINIVAGLASANVDNFAHIGGLLGGLLFGFATSTSLSIFENVRCCFKNKADKEEQQDNSEDQKSLCARPSTIYEGKRQSANQEGKRQSAKEKRIGWWRNSLLSGGGTQKYKCSVPLWIFRLVTGGVLTYTIIALFIKLLVTYKYKPSGDVSFYYSRECCCCYESTTTMEFWKCHYCDLSISGGYTWGDKCGKSRTAADVDNAAGKNFTVNEPSLPKNANGQFLESTARKTYQPSSGPTVPGALFLDQLADGEATRLPTNNFLATSFDVAEIQNSAVRYR